MFAYFNNVPVSRFISPNPLITDAAGRISGVFTIPDPNFPGNPLFPTGEIEFKLSSDSTRGAMINDASNGNPIETLSEGFAIYYAVGMFDQYQNVSLSLRPPPPPPAPPAVYIYRTAYAPYDVGEDGDAEGADGDADGD